MSEFGIIIQYNTAPRNDEKLESAINVLIDAMAEEEFGSGGVMSYAFYKVPHITGSWYSFAQYTASGLAAHGKGAKVGTALSQVESLLCEPASELKLDPVIIKGCGERIPTAPPRPADANPAEDVGVVYSFRVEPGQDDVLEEVMRRVFKVVERAEISTGNVLTYNLYRDPSGEGKWVMFEHFTAKGSANHATDPEIFGPGLEHVAMLPEPFSRVVLNPFRVYGCGEPLPSTT